MNIKDFIGKATYDNCGQFIWGVGDDGEHQKLADLRGWGAIQNLFKTKDGKVDTDEAARFQDELGKWIVDAINEKIERDVNVNTIQELSVDLKRKIEIHIETTEECIENFSIPNYVKELLEQDIELYRKILGSH